MKAEQRKELETNTLADKMGHMMQRVKSGQRRTVILYFVLAAGAMIALWIGYRYWIDRTVASSMQWLSLYDGSVRHVGELADKDAETTAGKAARLQIAWVLFWELGVKSAAADKVGALAALREASDRYGKLVEDRKDDKVFEPQAMLGLAVTTESLAVQDTKRLKKAAELYKELSTKYPASAEGKFARERLEILDDPKSTEKLAATYEDLRRLFLIDLPIAPPMFPPGGDPFHKGNPLLK